MNLNQSAHGDREFGYIGTRLRCANGRRRHWQTRTSLANLDVGPGQRVPRRRAAAEVVSFGA